MNHTVGAFCFATLCLLIYSSSLWAFQDMVCPADRTNCSTMREDGAGVVKIFCRTTQPTGTHPSTHVCTKATRDWGQSSSPYAHTSTLWRCADGSREIFIFTSDFDQDAVRCDLVCGKCKTKWRIKP